MKTVLTVDDSRVVRSMASRHLQPYGCRVLEAGNGREGVEAARTHEPDLILLDVTMPVMDGRQALTAIRADAGTTDIPVIMLAPGSARELVDEIAALGIAGCLVKPFEQCGFDREVSKILGPPASTARLPVDQPRELVEQVHLAAAAVATAEELVSALLVDEGRCAVLRLPDPRAAVFTTVLPALQRALRALAGAGRHTLIVDLADLAETKADVAGAVVGLVGAADRAGFRTAVCAPPGPLAERLEQLAQTQNRLYASRQAAREALQ